MHISIIVFLCCKGEQSNPRIIEPEQAKNWDVDLPKIPQLISGRVGEITSGMWTWVQAPYSRAETNATQVKCPECALKGALSLSLLSGSKNFSSLLGFPGCSQN